MWWKSKGVDGFMAYPLSFGIIKLENKKNMSEQYCSLFMYAKK